MPPEPFKHGKAADVAAPRLRLDAIGMEAEFELWVDGRRARPEDVFGDPRRLVGGPLMHRTGRSYALPNGAAVYFDTGVIEVATPAMEVSRGVAARAARSLWEAIGQVRDGLDRWEARTGRDARLVGFSAHYNVSFDGGSARPGRTVEDLAWTLAHVLPFPMALVAANRRSTGVGVRPRGDRVEVTVDFTPGPALTAAAGALAAGVARALMAWPVYSLDEAARRGFPVVDGYRPQPHTSRKGWLAHATAFPTSPFAADPDAPLWTVRGRGEPASLRRIAAEVFARTRTSVEALANPFTFRLLRLLFGGHAPALLDLPDRPAAYEDVGRLCRWDDLFPERVLARSRYEQVLVRAIAGRRLRVGARWLRPVGLVGWSGVRFRRDDGALLTLPVDDLVAHLDRWS